MRMPSPMELSTIGLDLAKSILQIHGLNTAGEVVVRKAHRRSKVLSISIGVPRCLAGKEACGTTDHWARELPRLRHTIRLMPPTYVKLYVRRGKIDAKYAGAVTQPVLRFVPMKKPYQQAALALHRVSDLSQRLAMIPASALSRFDATPIEIGDAT